ncbi:MAG: DUF4136 domain-containing protein [Granulosicoccus sp.]|nr:DUF4136 domain-containing protein [Granulosicoccus sp.]
MLKHLAVMAMAVATLMMSACNTISTTGTIAVESSRPWAILPIANYSTTPKADETLATLVETRLRSRGVRQLESFRSQESLSLVSLLDKTPDNTALIQKALSQGYQYGITGSVLEWHYKSGPDREPAVGLSLKVIDLASQQVVWQGSASRTGWAYSNLSSVADKVIRDLLKQVKFPG